MKECDLIMKGGVTSGVVYPHAVVEIAGAYRLRSIGGTSAGAIAAAVTAAAEYRRQASPKRTDFAGFEEIRKLASEIGSDLKGLFQPTTALAPLFEILTALIDTKPPASRAGAVVGTLLRLFRPQVLAGAAVGAVLIVLALVWWNPALLVLGVVAGLLLAAGLVALALGRLVLAGLPANWFGICSGLTPKPPTVAGKQALTDWLADRIDIVAGNLSAKGEPGAPLTVGQLRAHGIELAAMTTDLSSRRPYQLPLKSGHHYFSKGEFERLFPARVVTYLVGDRKPLAVAAGVPQDLYPLPAGDDFPVLLVARMSLSFPGLISAIPLYRFDDQLRLEGDSSLKIRRCLFSDGGISSNFPIHFFDALLPSRPTFGITLADWEEVRHGAERVQLPRDWRQSTDLPINGVDGLGQFAGAILNAAKDWQDTLQSLLPGYAERIVEIRLDPKREGGLNLTMDPATIAELGEYGRQAGAALVRDFDFDEHRWRRALSLLPKLEEALEGFERTYAGAPPDALPYPEILRSYTPGAYKENSLRWRKGALAPFAEALAAVGAKRQAALAAGSKGSIRRGKVPAVDTSLRLLAATDRAPVRKNGD